VRDEHINVEYIQIEAMVVDPLTKGLLPVIFRKHFENMVILEYFDVLGQWKFSFIDFS